MSCNHPLYRETFLKEYPNLLAQSVYTSFCHSFPDSFRQFNEYFKEDLVRLVYEWVTGVLPQPRIWLNWNLKVIEPPHLKKHEEMINQANSTEAKGSSIINFDLVEKCLGTGSHSAIPRTESLSSIVSNKHGFHSRNMGRQKSPSKQSLSSSMSSGSGGDSAITKVAEAQKQSTEMSPPHSPRKKRCAPLSPLKRLSSLHTQDPNLEDYGDPLTPIHEYDGEEEQEGAAGLGLKAASDSQDLVKSYISRMKTRKRSPRQSHPIGRGPDFVRHAFNLNGRSPLVSHFLRMQGLERQAGANIRVQRTQQENPPPLNAQTYRDVMREGYKNLHELEKNYGSFVKRSMKSNNESMRRQKEEVLEHRRKLATLLAKPGEIQRLGDLLMLELTKDPDSIAVGADAAIEAALQSP